MRIRSVGVGAIAGAVGGMAMAMWSMVVFAATGDGFWNPVNLIAHTFYDQAPLDGTFNGTAAFIGIAAHMMIAMSLGIVIALLAARFVHGPAATVALALGVTMAAWLGGVVIWDAVDSTAFQAFTPWVLATGHAMFAMATGGVVAVLDRHKVHAAGSERRGSDLVRA
jgi:hypothetical protein